MPFAPIDGRRMHYTDTGGDGPALVFLHAFSTNLTLWDPMVARFATGHRCLAIDLPGHGQSDPVELPRGIGSLADMVVAVMDDAGIARAHVCGLSIGGMIAQHLGFEHPSRILSLTLACTTARLAPEASALWDARLAAIESKGLWAQIGETMERWYGEGLMEAFGPADLDPIARMIGSTSVAGALACGLAVKGHDATGGLASIAAPTLVIGGDNDLSFPRAHTEALAAGIPGARLAMLPRAGHLAPVQVPDAFDAVLRDFLTAL